MAKRKISKSQAVSMALLWLILCYILLTSVEKIDFMVVFSIVASAVIVFVPVYKSLKRK